MEISKAEHAKITRQLYRERTREKYNEYHHNYREEHYEKISALERARYIIRNQPVQCDCGVTIGTLSMKGHITTKKHKKWAAANEHITT